MPYARNERIFPLPDSEADDVVRGMAERGYGYWVIRHLSGLGFFIELSDKADDQCRLWLKRRLSK
jgi:hypothetical protein